MNDFDLQTLANIEQYGCSVIHVYDPDDGLPPFAYSVGITQSSAVPEIIVVGLKQPLAHAIVNNYNRRVRAGEAFQAGQRYDEFIEGHAMLAVAVEREHYAEYFGYGLRFYRAQRFAAEFKALQFVYPNTAGIWPWQDAADAAFRAWQPLLGDIAASANAGF